MFHRCRCVANVAANQRAHVVEIHALFGQFEFVLADAILRVGDALAGDRMGAQIAGDDACIVET